MVSRKIRRQGCTSMATSLEYYFSSHSPWTYLGHDAICHLADRQGLRLDIRPVDVAAVWADSGSVPLPQRSMTRQRYRLIELQRYALYRDLPLNLHPKHFPTDPTLADLATIALVADGADARQFMSRVFRSVWVNEEDIASEDLLAGHLRACGFEPSAVLDHARGEDCATIRLANTEAAIEARAIGIPAYVLNGEVFWGQDRINMIEHMLATGRDAIH